MKKIIIVMLIISGLTACVQSSMQTEESRLKEAYSSCINTAKDNTDKIEACQNVLNVLKQEKVHERFTHEESVRVLNYKECLQAKKTGNNAEAAISCDEIWKEIHSNNTSAQ